MWDTIGFPLAFLLVDEKLVSGLGEIIIAGCYFLISILLLRDLRRDWKAGIRWLIILIGMLLLFCSGSYFFFKITTLTFSNVGFWQVSKNWMPLLPAIAFFIIYQRYQFLANSIHGFAGKPELEKKLNETKNKLQQQTQSLQAAHANLQEIKAHLGEIERLTILGQLVSGIAHEINNPINFIYGNLPYIEEYSEGLLKVIDTYQTHYPVNPEIEKAMEEADLDYVRSDFPVIVDSIKVGTDRIRELVDNLRSFYRNDESQMKLANINLGIESSLLLLYNFYKNKVQIIKQLDELPLVECHINQINQVFLTLVAKAINGLLEAEKKCPDLDSKKIVITSKTISNNCIIIQIILNIEIKEGISEPKFTNKLIGIGTGLGLTISHRIITEVHRGKIYCQSNSGEGTIFTIELPIIQETGNKPQEVA